MIINLAKIKLFVIWLVGNGSAMVAADRFQMTVDMAHFKGYSSAIDEMSVRDFFSEHY